MLNNKFRQLFVWKRMTPEQMARWEKPRRKGRARYVVLFALWLGTFMVAVMSFIIFYLDGAPFSARRILVNALIDYPLGSLLGFYLWYNIEKKYLETLYSK
jgi:hypothetical protein